MPDPIDSFIATIHAKRITTVILGWQQEWDLTAQRGFGPVRRARLIAYGGGEVIAADVGGEEAERETILDRLRAAGLHVELRSHNRA